MESLAEIETRHERELEELAERVKQMLKGAKKSTRAQVEAEVIQLQFDLKARHREELEEAEERGLSEGEIFCSLPCFHDVRKEPPSVGKEPQVTKQSREAEIKEEEERIAAQKKAKAKKKQVDTYIDVVRCSDYIDRKSEVRKIKNERKRSLKFKVLLEV